MIYRVGLRGVEKGGDESLEAEFIGTGVDVNLVGYDMTQFGDVMDGMGQARFVYESTECTVYLDLEGGWRQIDRCIDARMLRIEYKQWFFV